MCGVFGFVSRDGRGPDLVALERIARVTEQRGPHAFGFAWIDGRGRLRCYKQTGRVSDHLGLLRMAADAVLLIGHCRYATHGSPAQAINNHPHPADGGWIVHNGTLPLYEGLVAQLDLHPVGDCDSEILGLLVERARGSIVDRCRAAVRTATGALLRQPLVLLGLWARPARLVVVRQGNPLCVAQAGGGTYLASLSEGMPGRPAALPDDSVRLFTRTEVRHGTL